MSWHIGGGQGEGGGPELGKMTQGIGYPLREVSESSVVTFGLTATDDAGDGTVEGDVNATDFTSQTGTTYAEILPQYIVTVVHKSVAYLYQGPRPVSIGVGGDFVTLAENYTALGTADHNLLVNLGLADQHPQSAITGLLTDQATQDQNLIDHEQAADPHPQYALETAVLENFVLAGYGGIGVDSNTAMPNIGAAYQTLTGFDIALIDVPKYVNQDYPNNGIHLDAEGVWQVSVKVSLTFAESNAGRTIQLRFWNDTKSVAASTEFNYFVGRNQSGANLAFTLNVNFPASEVGDLIQLQVASPDTYTTVVNIGTIYQANHISEAQFL